MRKFLFLAGFLISLAAAAQTTRDTNPREEQNTRGANTDAAAQDPAVKARVRTEGVPGGTGAEVPPEARAGAEVTDGRQHRHRERPPDPTPPSRGEASSEREAARGARGPIR